MDPLSGKEPAPKRALLTPFYSLRETCHDILMAQTFPRFLATTAATWTGLFGLLWLVNLSDAVGSLPGRLTFSVTFLLLVCSVLLAATLAGKASPSIRSGAAVALWAALGAYAAMSLIESRPPLAFAVGGVLLVGSTWLMASLGREVISPTYLWPLVLVVVCFDFWSVFSPDGVTNQLVTAPKGPAMFNFLVFTVPIPGMGLQPVLGIGDALFLGFLAGAVHHLNLPPQRFLSGVVAGFVLCLVALLIWEKPLPALIFVAPATAIALGRSISTSPKEMLTAVAFVTLIFGTKVLLTGM